jgi:glutamate/tyrosine decarboxylase-like PLP-dependent enzyme
MGVASEKDVLLDAARRAIAYKQTVVDRSVAPSSAAINQLDQLYQPLPQSGLDPLEIVRLLDTIGSPATVASTGGRFFGLVVGGTLPAALAANWLATAWDQNACFRFSSPISAALEDVCLQWLKTIFGLPADVGGAFVTGASMANLAALASARHALLSRAGWNVEAHGLYGAPEIRVVVSEEVHVTVLKALALLGFGRERVVRVPTDERGRMRSDALPPLDDRTIVCVQAGNVNTGDFDPVAEVCRRARDTGAWVHVDGAFGLWALAHPRLAPLAEGICEADSWATDGHKWLNVPYDNGIVLVREADNLRAAMALNAAYLATGAPGDREPSHYTPESSRRARGVDVWAALLSLGTDGIANLVERSCRHAQAFARSLSLHGFEILNEVVLNQVLVSFGSAERTKAVVEKIQTGGILWCGTTVWQGRTAMRISVSNWVTTTEDVQMGIEEILRVAKL